MVVDDVANPTSATNFILPLLEILTIVPVGRQIAAQPVLAIMISSRAWFGPQHLEAADRICQRVTAQFLPADDSLGCAEPDIPLTRRWRNRDPVSALWAHAMASTGPKSPSVSLSACA
jgi:hypothetical protein